MKDEKPGVYVWQYVYIPRVLPALRDKGVSTSCRARLMGCAVPLGGKEEERHGEEGMQAGCCFRRRGVKGACVYVVRGTRAVPEDLKEMQNGRWRAKGSPDGVYTTTADRDLEGARRSRAVAHARPLDFPIVGHVDRAYTAAPLTGSRSRRDGDVNMYVKQRR